MKSKHDRRNSLTKVFSDPSLYALILLLVYGMIIYPGCILNTRGTGGGGGPTFPPSGCVGQEYYYYDLHSYFHIYRLTPPVTYTIDDSHNLPPGLVLDGVNGIISGPIEDEAEPGDYTFEITATDSTLPEPNTPKQEFTLEISDFLMVTRYLPPVCSGLPYEASISVCGGEPPYRWEITEWSPDPQWLNFPPGDTDEPENFISGTPDVNGTFTFKVVVTDGAGLSTEPREFTLRVTDQPRILTYDLPVGIMGRPYTAALEACGGTGVYEWEITEGELPSGFPPPPDPWVDGMITGIPDTAGVYAFKVRVTDESGGDAERNFHITVIEALTISTPPITLEECTPIPPGIIPVGTISGGLGEYYWEQIEGEELPPELSLSREGFLHGTPIRMGEYHFRVRLLGGTIDPLDPPTPRITVNVVPDVSMPPEYFDGLEIVCIRQELFDSSEYESLCPAIINRSGAGVKIDFHFVDTPDGRSWEEAWINPDNSDRRQATLKIIGICSGDETTTDDVLEHDLNRDGTDEYIARFEVSDFALLIDAGGGIESGPFTFRLILDIPGNRPTRARPIGHLEDIEVIDE